MLLLGVAERMLRDPQGPLGPLPVSKDDGPGDIAEGGA